MTRRPRLATFSTVLPIKPKSESSFGWEPDLHSNSEGSRAVSCYYFWTGCEQGSPDERARRAQGDFAESSNSFETGGSDDRIAAFANSF